VLPGQAITAAVISRVCFDTLETVGLTVRVTIDQPRPSGQF